MKARHRILLILFFVLFTAGCMSAYTWRILRTLPDELYIYNNKETTIELDIPVTAVIKETNQTVDFSKPVTFQAKDTADYSLEYKLFNLISLPSGKLSVLEENYMYAGGFAAGMYIKTDGVLVVDIAQFTDSFGNVCSPSMNLLTGGDYIISINGTEVTRKSEIAKILENSDGTPLLVEYNHEDVTMVTQITPVMNEAGEYKLGIWVKDDDQGIGTITYIDKNGNFGALGHGMSDSSTGELLDISNGFLYKTSILSITKSHDDTPGEYVGVIDYSSSNRLGLISANKKCGIFGTLPASKCEELIEKFGLSAYEIGFKREVCRGSAQILLYIDDELMEYEIEIEEISHRDEKNITFKITSEKLIEQTNGIVRGMSGAPIIQNGKIIGAVTHVFVNDSKRGYGIFIENMINS